MVSGATAQQLVTWLTYHRAIGEGGEKEREGGKKKENKGWSISALERRGLSFSLFAQMLSLPTPSSSPSPPS